jgi:hypothetical protein
MYVVKYTLCELATTCLSTSDLTLGFLPSRLKSLFNISLIKIKEISQIQVVCHKNLSESCREIGRGLTLITRNKEEGRICFICFRFWHEDLVPYNPRIFVLT